MDALTQVSGMIVANTSQHLQQLRQAGLVANRKEGQKVFYFLSELDVEAANALDNAYTLKAGESHRMTMTLVVR